MPVLYVNLSEQKSLSREPYSGFAKSFNAIKENLNGEQIEIRVGNGKEGTFSNGFYIDENFFINPSLKFDFAVVPPDTDKKGQAAQTFVRMTYSYEGEDTYDLQFHLQKVKALKKRVPYFYIPNATHLEFSSQVDDEMKFQFDVLVADNDKVLEVCYSLINQIITIFSLDD